MKPPYRSLSVASPGLSPWQPSPSEAASKWANLHALAQSKTALQQAWHEFAIVDISQPLVEKAGVYADAFVLRGYDSVQLAAAHNLREQCSLPLTFACYDRRLNQAAQLLQFQVLP